MPFSLKELPQPVKENIISRYLDGAKIADLAKELKLSHESIYGFLYRKSVPIRKDNWSSNRRYLFDVHSFDVIDTPEKAYWLGLLYADGNNFEKRYSVSLGLAGEDGQHVIKFAQFLKLDRPIEWKKYPPNNKRKPLGTIVATDMYFSKQVARLGIVSNKTFKVIFPSEKIVPEFLLSHFIRGYMDGDGSISYDVRNKGSGQRPTFSVSFTGHAPLIQGIRELLFKRLGIKGTVSIRHKNEPRVQSLIYCGNRKVQTVLDWIYKDDTISLPRKRAKYDLLIWQNSHSISKAVKQLTLDGQLVKCYSSAQEAATAINGNKICIRACAAGHAMRYNKKGEPVAPKLTYKGFIWRYTENPFLSFHE